ncbi:MAG: hypothetical protein K2J87_04765, partial [Muribaculaceae bacterium]|nr:hypothetical protein [Muribaculaceae bacterium]
MKTEILYGILFTSALSLFSARAAGEEPDNLPDEYLKNLKDYEFVNTRGMKDLIPNRIPWIDKDRQDPDNWEFPTDNEIQTLRDMGISFPDFEFIEGGKLNPGQKRQQTHVVEHIIYALPGDAVSLYPYYGLEEYKEPTGDNFLSTRDYLETFSHWYDYNTGGRVIHESKSTGKAYDLLDFPYDRGYIQVSDYGFYGGIYMSPGTKDVPQPAPKYIVSSTNEYVDAVNAINADGGKGHIELTCDLDFSGINDVPMLGNDDSTPFTGIIDGRDYAIKNLNMSRDQHKVGLIRNGGNGVAIYNLVLDNCTLSGWTHVGLVAYLTGGGLIAKNIKINSNCTIKGTGSEGEHFVGAILGRCDNEDSDNHLTVENVYVGGTVGNPDLGMRFNTALCGWLHTRMSVTPSYFKNIVVDCSLTGHEPLKRETYVRHSLGNEPYEDATGGWIEQGKFDNSDVTWTFNFKNCYGNFNQIGDYTDPIWKPFA